MIACRRRFAISWLIRQYHSGDGVYGHIPRPISNASEQLMRQRSANTIDCQLSRLVDAYRTYGHYNANLDPLNLSQNRAQSRCELEPSNYGLDANKKYNLHGLLACNNQTGSASLPDVKSQLSGIYCGPVGAEFMHLLTFEERDWFAGKMETFNDSYRISDADRRTYAKIMLECQNFDHYLATKFGTVKRYGGEGAESMMLYFLETFRHGAATGVKQVVCCMPHRGRLNFLTTLLNYPAVIMFQKMKGKSELPSNVKGLGDVLSHLSIATDLDFDGRKLHFTILPNPSHLEANNPVAVGKARGRLQSYGLGDYNVNGNDGNEAVLCLQVHGDASFSGQGIVAETLAFSQTPHYSIDGSVHLIVNNQIGFTTEGVRGRSSDYCSDLAKMAACPILHVNADHPEMVARASRLALDYRQKFRKDIFVDLVCFRRWGHNELDDPTITQPVMYAAVESRQSIPDVYADELEKRQLLSKDERQTYVNDHTNKMNEQFKLADSYVPEAAHLAKQWSNLQQAPSNVEIWDTGVDTDVLKFIGVKSVEHPSNLDVHSHLKKTHCEARIKKISEERGLDWATAEALALGSLLYQGIPCRISGQDVGRGTFSHRHVMLVDRKTDAIYVPLNNIKPDQKAFLEVANSILSEEAVLGFEYGMAVENPHRLVIWEAQFGDFFNTAQVIIDTYISSGESKWLVQNGLVMLLPHGFDGAGPEHSSCRIERFLQLTDSRENFIDGEDVNMNIAHPTTSAQYFHLLRRQVLRNYRKPLIVASPKTLLRMSDASSTIAEMAPGTYFQPVLSDATVEPSRVTKIIFCSGKHYYALSSYRESNKIQDVALIRLEALCPFPAAELQEILRRYPRATKFVWSQEEPRNAGYWSFIQPRFRNLVGCNPEYAGRPELPIVAVAVGQLHREQHEQVLKDTFR